MKEPKSCLTKREQAEIAELIDKRLAEGAQSYTEIAREVVKLYGTGAATRGVVASRKARRFGIDGRAPFWVPRSWGGVYKRIFFENAPTKRADEVHDLMLVRENLSGAKAPSFHATLSQHGRFRRWLAARGETNTAPVTVQQTLAGYSRALLCLDEFERAFIYRLCASPNCTTRVAEGETHCNHCRLQLVALVA